MTPLSFDACFRRFRSGVPDCSPPGDGGGLFPENAPVTPVTRDACFLSERSGVVPKGGGSSPRSIDSSMYSTSGRISALLRGSAIDSPASMDPKCFSSQASWPMATARFQICSSKDFLGSRLRGVLLRGVPVDVGAVRNGRACHHEIAVGARLEERGLRAMLGGDGGAHRCDDDDDDDGVDRKRARLVARLLWLISWLAKTGLFHGLNAGLKVKKGSLVAE